jgi:hypothetical protein
MDTTVFLDEKLHNKVKKIADSVYKRHGAYKSMYIVKLYKKLGGKFNPNYSDDKLTQWKKEKWIDVGNASYPVYRPSIRINKNTPLTIDEIDNDNLIKQIKLKQKIKDKGNLPPFKSKDHTNIRNVPKKNIIWNYSNPTIVRANADANGYSNVEIYLSDKPEKKYMLYHPETNKKIYFGMMGFKDYTETRDENKKNNFQNRNKKWKNSKKYTPSNLAYYLLWT